MHRIDEPTAVASLPAPPPPGTPGYFTDGDEIGGTPATVVGAAWLNMVQEELAAIVTAGGLTLIKGVYNQVLLALQRLFFSTGDVKITFKIVADPGWLIADDGSIGNATSGATTRANADTQALFTLLWNNIPETWCPVQTSAGAPVSRGANAAADFAANRRLVLPKMIGRALAVAGAGAGLTSRALGQTYGQETVALTAAQNGPHAHGVNDPGHPHDVPDIGQNNSGEGGGPDQVLIPSGTRQTAPAPTGISIQQSGNGAPHENMQPSTFANVMIKL